MLLVEGFLETSEDGADEGLLAFRRVDFRQPDLHLVGGREDGDRVAVDDPRRAVSLTVRSRVRTPVPLTMTSTCLLLPP